MSELTDLVDLIAPNFRGDPKRRNAAIDMAARFIGATSEKWGPVYLDAIANLAAHYLTLYDPDGAFAGGGGSGGIAGAITSVRTGDWAISGEGSNAGSGGAYSDASLKLTVYGKEYLRLRDSRAAGKMKVVRPIATE